MSNSKKIFAVILGLLSGIIPLIGSVALIALLLVRKQYKFLAFPVLLWGLFLATMAIQDSDNAKRSQFVQEITDPVTDKLAEIKFSTHKMLTYDDYSKIIKKATSTILEQELLDNLYIKTSFNTLLLDSYSIYNQKFAQTPHEQSFGLPFREEGLQKQMNDFLNSYSSVKYPDSDLFVVLMTIFFLFYFFMIFFTGVLFTRYLFVDKYVSVIPTYRPQPIPVSANLPPEAQELLKETDDIRENKPPVQPELKKVSVNIAIEEEISSSLGITIIQARKIVSGRETRSYTSWEDFRSRSCLPDLVCRRVQKFVVITDVAPARRGRVIDF